LISGFFTPVADNYRMRMQVISVETAQIQYGDTVDVALDRTLANLLGVKPPEEIPPWANKWLYAGIRGGGSLGLFTLSDDIDGTAGPAPLSFGAGAQASLQITRFLAVQVEALYARDSFEYTVQYERSYHSSFTSSSLTLPALVKLTWRTKRFLFAGFAGPYLTIPIGAMEYESDIDEAGSYRFAVPVGISGGAGFGIKLGPGALFLDARYSRDLGNTSISDEGGTLAVYSRGKVSFSLGYEFGFIDK
jgi:hypothetical protein